MYVILKVTLADNCCHLNHDILNNTITSPTLLISTVTFRLMVAHGSVSFCFYGA